MRFDEKGTIVQVGENHYCAMTPKPQMAWRKQVAKHTEQVRAYLDSALVQKAVDSNA